MKSDEKVNLRSLEDNLQLYIEETIAQILNNESDINLAIQNYRNSLINIPTHFLFTHNDEISNSYDISSLIFEFNSQVFKIIPENIKEAIIDYMIKHLSQEVFSLTQMYEKLLNRGDYVEFKNGLELELKDYKLDLDFYKFEKSKISPEIGLPSFMSNAENIKVMLMYELGLFDLLDSKYSNMNPTKMAQIIETFTGIKQDTIRHTYREITGERTTNSSPKPFDDPKKMNELNRIIAGLKLIKKG